MLGYVVHRLLSMIPTLIAISIVIFVIIHLPPGDYFSTYIAELQSQGERANLAKIAFLKQHYGFDKPLWEQYLYWVVGLLRGAERVEALADADVVVYPSEHEIFGLVPVEALLAGTPVIVSDDSGSGEVVAATGGGQVIPVGDAHALARAIEQTLERRPDASVMAEAAARARALYGGEVVCAQLEDLYAELVERA